MKEIGVGIIGSGFMGRTHAEAIAKYVKGAHLVAVVGGTRATQLATDYGIEAETSVESLLKRSDVQAVIITTPHAVHGEQAILAAKYGKHVLVEKPLATTMHDCHKLIAACKDAGVNLMTAQSQRFRRGNMLAKQMISEGAIGHVLMVEELQINVGGLASLPPWQSNPENVGALLGYGVHNLDRLRWFVGDEAEWVSAVATTYTETAPVEASSMMLIKFRNGVAATVWSTFECPKPGLPQSGFRARIIGDRGVLDVDGYGLTQIGRGESWEVVYEQPKFNYRAEPLSPIRMESYGLQAQEFINSIIEQRSPAVTGEDGCAAVELALAAYESSRSGKTIYLPLKA